MSLYKLLGNTARADLCRHTELKMCHATQVDQNLTHSPSVRGALSVQDLLVAVGVLALITVEHRDYLLYRPTGTLKRDLLSVCVSYTVRSSMKEQRDVPTAVKQVNSGCMTDSIMPHFHCLLRLSSLSLHIVLLAVYNATAVQV